MAGAAPKGMYPLASGNEARAVGLIAEAATPLVAPVRIASPASLIGSVVVHATIVLALALALRRPTRPAEPLIEFEVGVVSESGATDSHGETLAARDLSALRGDSQMTGNPAVPEPSLQALGARPGTGAASGGAGIGTRDVIGTGGGTGGRGDEIGSGREVAGGGAVGTLWGVGAGQASQASSFIYVLDRSGSMQDTFPLLEAELHRAIGSLRDGQQFNVIWFSEGPGQPISPTMMAASTDNKLRTFEEVRRTTPAGRTQPTDALRQALALNPEVIYLLSDGDFGERNSEVFELVRQARAAGSKSTIHAILLRYDAAPDAEQALRRIAELGGGTYKHITDERLGG